MTSCQRSICRSAIAVLALSMLSFVVGAKVAGQSKAADAAARSIPLQDYLERQIHPEAVPGGFHLAFEGELEHALTFRVSSKGSLKIQCQLTAPNGYTRRFNESLAASTQPQAVRFSLGPLLGHGPYQYRPARFYPGEYFLSVEAADAATQAVVFTASFRLPPQEWIWADLTRLLYIDDSQAGVDLKLMPGALVSQLPAVVDLVEPLSGRVLSPPRRVVLTKSEARIPFELSQLGPGNYRVRVRPEIDGKIWPDGIERTLQLFRNGKPPAVSGTAKISDGPQLFVDNYLIDQAANLTAVFQPGKKAGDRPVLASDRPYEGHAVIAREAPVWDDASRRFRLAYSHVNYTKVHYEMLAESTDLISWTKPVVGKVEIDGSTQNNILKVRDESRVETLADKFAGVWNYASRGNPNLQGARFWQQGRPMTDDALHLKRGFYLTVQDENGKSFVTTTDPILFLREGGTETMTASGDTVAQFGYDETRGEFVVYTSPGPPNVGRWVRYDNSTKARTIARHATRDGVNWEARYIWVAPVDEPYLHNYGFRVRKVGDVYLGFFPQYNVRTQLMNLHLWVSRDGIHWEYPGGKTAWLDNGPVGSFDSGVVYMPVGWFEQGEQTRIFYHGANGLHFHAWIREKLSGLYGGMNRRDAQQLLTDRTFVDRAYLSAPSTRAHSWSLIPSGWSWRHGVHGTVDAARKQFWDEVTANTGETPETFLQRSRDFKIAVGLAEFRTNGFVARRAGEQEGTLTTHPLHFDGNHLSVNAAVSGSLAVEVLDASGTPLPGFSRAECQLGSFDKVNQPVRWRTNNGLDALKSRPVRLRFHLRNADLFGFQIR